MAITTKEAQPGAGEAVGRPATPAAGVSTARLWTGRTITALTVAFLLFDGMIKVLRTDAAMQGTAQLGYPEGAVPWIGLALLAGTVLYAIPRTAVLGAVLVTGYLGGAVATQVRVAPAWLLFPVAIGVLAWAGLVLRDGRLLRILVSRAGR